jgi:hypothetical protein
MTHQQTEITGSPPFEMSLTNSYYTPAALFFAQRDWVENAGDVASDTRSSGTSRLSPVTAIDCLYWSQVPTDPNPIGSVYPNGVYYENLIKFQCKFEYETAT